MLRFKILNNKNLLLREIFLSGIDTTEVIYRVSVGYGGEVAHLDELFFDLYEVCCFGSALSEARPQGENKTILGVGPQGN